MTIFTTAYFVFYLKVLGVSILIAYQDYVGEIIFDLITGIYKYIKERL